MIARVIMPRRWVRMRQRFGAVRIFGCTAVHTHSASVDKHVHNISKVPRTDDVPVQP
jgi:hypothetical protein